MTVLDLFVSDPNSPFIENIENLENRMGLKFRIHKYSDEQYANIFKDSFAPARARIDPKRDEFSLFIRLDRIYSKAHFRYQLAHEAGHILQYKKNAGLHFSAWMSITNSEQYYDRYVLIMECLIKRAGMQNKIQLGAEEKADLLPSVQAYANIFADLDVNTWLVSDQIISAEEYFEHLTDLDAQGAAIQNEYSTATLDSAWVSVRRSDRKASIAGMSAAVFSDAMHTLGRRLGKLYPIREHEKYQDAERALIASHKIQLKGKFGRFACWKEIDFCWNMLRDGDLDPPSIDLAFRELANRCTLFVRDFYDNGGRNAF